MAQDISIAALLAEEGFNTLAASRSARETLVRNGLTNHRKKNISVQKLSRVREVLARELYRVCDDPWCQAIAGMEARGGKSSLLQKTGAKCAGAQNHAGR